MSLTRLAVLLAGVYLILVGATSVSSTLTLVFGIVIVALVVLDGYGVSVPAVRRAP